MYNNLLKRGYTNLQDTEARVINSNELAAKKLGSLVQKRHPSGDLGAGDGFAAGLDADEVEGLFGDSEETVIKSRAHEDAAQVVEEARRQAEEILDQARSEALAECEDMRARVQAELERERSEALAVAQEQGYNDGMQKAEQEFAEECRKLEEEYQQIVDELEPRFIDTITGIYEHIFNVELSSYREILIHLIASTLRRAEGSKSFLVHVSAEDYPYVSMQKKEIAQNMMTQGGELEIVEDITLGQNECLIETEGGIFDCSLGVQMTELTRNLKLLSYENTNS